MLYEVITIAKKEQSRYCRVINHHPRLPPAQPENIANWIGYLANDFGSRPARYPEKLEKVAQYLESIFQTFGYQVIRQPHHHFHKTYNNIIRITSYNVCYTKLLRWKWKR